jgi:hypothetical protein
MSAAGIVSLVVASGVQGGSPHPLAARDTLVVVLLMAAMAAAGAALYIHRRRRAQRVTPVADEWRAQAVMGELCPHGWQAQLTLYGWGAPAPADAPASRAPLVELEWKQFEEESGRVLVARRVWAPSIGEALQAMVEDRRTDLTLEQIEHAAGDLEWGE